MNSASITVNALYSAISMIFVSQFPIFCDKCEVFSVTRGTAVSKYRPPKINASCDLPGKSWHLLLALKTTPIWSQSDNIPLIWTMYPIVLPSVCRSQKRGHLFKAYTFLEMTPRKPCVFCPPNHDGVWGIPTTTAIPSLYQLTIVKEKKNKM